MDYDTFLFYWPTPRDSSGTGVINLVQLVNF